MKLPALLLVLFGCTLIGCTSYNARLAPGGEIASKQRFFVRSNLNDSHAMDRRIASALAARDRTAEFGPLTMMPADTEVVVEYDDRWVWDFGEHLVLLRITLSEPKSGRQLAHTHFTARMTMIRDATPVVERLIAELLDGRAKSSR